MAGFQTSGGAADLGGERGSAEYIDPLDLPKELSNLMSGETEEGCEGLSIEGARALGGGDRINSSGSSTISLATQCSGKLGLTDVWRFRLEKLPKSSRSPDIVLRTSDPRRTLRGETNDFSRSSAGRTDGLGGTGGRTGVVGASAGGSLLGLGIEERRSSAGLSEADRTELSD